MKIGISLPWQYLAGIYDREEAGRTIYRDCSEASVFLEKLKKHGCESIELRHWDPEITDKDLIKSFKNITDAGLIFSIHGDIKPDHDKKTIQDAFPWLSFALDGLKSQEKLTIVIHPVKEIGGDTELLKIQTESILKHYCSEIEKKSLPVIIAYENQREKGFADPALSFKSISETVTSLNRKEIGTCWDMGHSYANYLKNSYEELPDDVFLKNAVHTHIHDLSEKTGATHWPLIFGNTPVEKYIRLLEKHNYKGIYNLELSAERFSSLNIEENFLKSIDLIKGILK